MRSRLLRLTLNLTRPRGVTLSLSTSDPAPTTGVTAVQISNAAAGPASASWKSYAPSKQWTLSSGVGTKTVYVQDRDAAANQSAVAQETIRYEP